MYIKDKMESITQTELAKAFSIGEFEKTYKYLSDDATWMIVGEKTITGKQAILDHCGQVAAYFESVFTNFHTLNIVSNQHRVVVEGTAEFLKDDKRVSFIAACDVYEFNNDGQIQRIASYCIPEK